MYPYSSLLTDIFNIHEKTRTTPAETVWILIGMFMYELLKPGDSFSSRSSGSCFMCSTADLQICTNDKQGPAMWIVWTFVPLSVGEVGESSLHSGYLVLTFPS